MAYRIYWAAVPISQWDGVTYTGIEADIITGNASWVGAVYGDELAPTVADDFLDEAPGLAAFTGYYIAAVPSDGTTEGTVVVSAAITTDTLVATGTGLVTVQGYTPTVVATDNKTVATQTGSVIVTGHAPTVNASNNTDVNTLTGSITVIGYSPTVSTDANITTVTGTGSIVVSGHSPTVAVTDNKFINTGVGSVQVVGYRPTVLIGNFVLMKVWNGTWTTGTLNRWTGTEWTQTHNLKKWDGSDWVSYKA